MEKIDVAKTRIMIKAPFYGALLMKLKTKEDPTCRTMWVDGKTLGYNPGFLGTLNDNELEAVLTHEVWHCALKHHARRNGRDPRTWNAACDYAINGILKDEGFALPKGALINDIYKDQDAEAIFTTLWAKKQKEREENLRKEKASGNGNGKATEQTSKGDDDDSDEKTGISKGTEEDLDDDAEEEDVDGDGIGEDDDADNDEDDFDDNEEESEENSGGSKDNNKDNDEDNLDNAGEIRDADEEWESDDCGEVRDYDGDAEETEQNDAAWTDAICEASAISSAMGIGDGAGGAERLIQSLGEPEKSPEDLLREFIEMAFDRSDYTFTRPNVRYQGDCILPSLHNPSIPSIVIACDTSGSMGDDDLMRAGKLINSVMEIYDSTYTVICCDARVRHVEELTQQDLPLSLKARGGGGTDFDPVFQWVKENMDMPPVALLYVTDMGGSVRASLEPDFPVMWMDISKVPSYYGKRKYTQYYRDTVGKGGGGFPFGEYVFCGETE